MEAHCFSSPISESPLSSESTESENNYGNKSPMAYSSIIRRPLKDSENLHRTSCRMTCCDAFDRQNKLIDKQFMMENENEILKAERISQLQKNRNQRAEIKKLNQTVKTIKDSYRRDKASWETEKDGYIKRIEELEKMVGQPSPKMERKENRLSNDSGLGD